MTDPARAQGDGEPFDLSTTFIHLGLGSTATPLPDFSWALEGKLTVNTAV